MIASAEYILIPCSTVYNMIVGTRIIYAKRT